MPTQQRTVAREVTDEFGRTWLEFDMAKFRMLKDSTPESGAYLLVAAGYGGRAGWQALAKGDRGFSPTIIVNSFEELPADNPTPGTVTSTELAPATDSAGPVIGLDIAIRRGADGDPGAAVIDPGDYGSPAVGQILTVAAGLTDFELSTPMYGGLHWPATVSDAPAGTTGSPFTLATINVPAGTYNVDYRLIPQGQCRMEATSTNIVVNLVARLGAVDGPIIGICKGLGGVAKERLTFSPGPAAGSATSVGRISAGQAGVIYINTERQSGLASYQALADYSQFSAIAVRA